MGSRKQEAGSRKQQVASCKWQVARSVRRPAAWTHFLSIFAGSSSSAGGALSVTLSMSRWVSR